MAGLIIRVDDFPGTKPEEFYRHNLESFKSFDEVMTEAGFPSYVLGIIPGYLSSEDLEFFRSNERITTAMHGITHDESRLDEFDGLPYHEILGKVFPVKRALETHLERSFADYIPPHNVLNQVTAKVLKFLGFQNVYGGPGSDLSADLHGLDFRFSEFPWEYGRSDELLVRGSVEHISEKVRERDIYLTLHFPWEINIGLDNLKRYLTELKKVV